MNSTEHTTNRKQLLNGTTGNILVFGALAVSGMLTRGALERAWEKKTAKPAPKDPGAPDVSWKEALLWGAVVGTATGLIRTMVRRKLGKRVESSDLQS